MISADRTHADGLGVRRGAIAVEMIAGWEVPEGSRPTASGSTPKTVRRKPSGCLRNDSPERVALSWLIVLFAAWLSTANASVGDPPLAIRGQTMGTTYSVKFFQPENASLRQSDVMLEVEKELRRVNDQMSTYIDSSEISRFNASTSTQPFPVSIETAQVIDEARQISKATEGAFDITVAPLVNLWNFGPDPRRDQLPSNETIAITLQDIGFEKIEVTLNPPTLRKTSPGVTIDLSAIAKGHGVDRVIQKLRSLSIEDAFVEIGGEVRVMGDKRGTPWKVGIQTPDALSVSLAVAVSLDNQALATSGDYRNFFTVGDRTYSHTINPSTGRPVEHKTCSVSVIAEDCMTADAWATALNVLDVGRAKSIADQQRLQVLIATRQSSGPSPSYNWIGTGMFTTFVAAQSKLQLAQSGSTDASFMQQMLPVLAVTAIFFALVIAGMAVGVMFGRKSISGSCGGLNAQTDADGTSRCSLCQNPSEACQELRDRAGQASAGTNDPAAT